MVRTACERVLLLYVLWDALLGSLRRVSRGVEHRALLLAGFTGRELGREALPGAGGMGYVVDLTCTSRHWPTVRTAEADELGAFSDGLDKDDPIQHPMIDALEYYGELSKCKFLIAPRVHGIQSPKMMEALLVRQLGCAHACPVRALLYQRGASAWARPTECIECRYRRRLVLRDGGSVGARMGASVTGPYPRHDGSAPMKACGPCSFKSATGRGGSWSQA
eukprot:scaffold20_cov361-Prasinococcus_capsulatus_cf.AAC.1